MRLLEILRDIDFELIQGSLDMDIKNISYDSRKVEDSDLFVALKGANFDAHDFLDDVHKKGAIALLVQEDRDYPTDITVVKVKDTRKSLAYISSAFFDYPERKMITIGVTGTKGKTTTTHMIKTMLEKAGKKVGLIGTNGIIIGNDRVPTLNTTPESYELHKAFDKILKAGCEYMIMEVSSQGLKMHRTAAIKFDYAVFTNISHDHIGPNEHADFKEYLECKSMLFRQAKIGLVNLDDEYSKKIIEGSRCEDLYTFGKNGYFSYSNIDYVANEQMVGLKFDFIISKTKELINAKVGIPGEFNVENAMVALSLCYLMNFDKAILGEALAKIWVDGRMETAYASDKFSIIIDYAHNAISMERLLNTLRNYNPKRLVVVFGCGGNRAKERRYSMGESAGKMADFTIITTDNSRYEAPRDIMADIRMKLEPTGGKFIEIEDRREAIYHAVKNAREGDMIAIIGKGHEDYQEINGVRHHFLDREVVDEAVEKFVRGVL